MSSEIGMQGSQPTNFMVIFGGIVVAGFLVYLIFMAANNFGLSEKKGTATILEKGYRQAGRTYITQVIGKRTMTIPQITPEMYILKLDINGRQAEFAASKSQYNALNAGDQVQMTYKHKRITGSMQVLNVNE